VTLGLLGRCRPHPFKKLESSSETGPVGTVKVHPKETLRTQFVPKGRKDDERRKLGEGGGRKKQKKKRRHEHGILRRG
jgi:hypothetical protein